MKGHDVVTGGAGFIGSHLVETLVAAGRDVVVVDDLRTGDRARLDGVADDITFIEGDCAGKAAHDALPGAGRLWHLAADPDVRAGAADPRRPFEANVVATERLLSAMQHHGVADLLFTSTSTVYGRAATRPTPESYGPLLPISIYGATKLACEALIAGHVGTYGGRALLFRFANVVGPRAGHGVLVDFVAKLRRDPTRLEMLGDGTQEKSYVSVRDTVQGMLVAAEKAPVGCHPFNIGSPDAIPVRRIAELAAEATKTKPKIVASGGTQEGSGWVGDVKFMLLDTKRLEALGWRPRDDSAAAVRSALAALV